MMVINMRPTIVIGLLAILLGTGFWGVYQLTNSSPPAALENNADTTLTAVTNAESSRSNSSFYPTYRVQRDKIRSQQLELLRDIIKNSNTDEKTKEAALNRLLNITTLMEKELKAEGLLKAEGFKDGVVIIEDGSATVVIAGPALSETKLKETKHRLAGVLNNDVEKINIIYRE